MPPDLSSAITQTLDNLRAHTTHQDILRAATTLAAQSRTLPTPYPDPPPDPTLSHTLHQALTPLTPHLAESPLHTIGHLYQTLLALPAPTHTQRKTTGAYYTPTPLINHILDTTLEPTIQAALDATQPKDHPAAILNIHICDPSCGTGYFLIAAAQRLANHLERALKANNQPPSPSPLHQVLTHCIHAVDLDPLATQLCRISLWLEANDPTLPLESLATNIKTGNTLLGNNPPNTQRPTPNAKRPTPNAQCPMPNAKCPTPNAKCPVPSAQCLLPNAHSPAPPQPNTPKTQTNPLFHYHQEFPTTFNRPNPGFDAILGNPPFLNQLESATATDRTHAAIIRERTNGASQGYADTAATFLLISTYLTRRGGRIGLVQPHSVLAARDAAPIRRAVLERAGLTHLWIAGTHVFDAGVYTIAPTLQIGAPRTTTLTRTHTPDFTPLPNITLDNNHLAESEETWAHLAAAAAGIPEISLPPGPPHRATVGDIATCTADFRDQYYGLEGFIIEDADLPASAPPPGPERDALYPPLITCGLIDLAHRRWGQTPTRILKKRWQAPRVDRQAMQARGSLAPWIDQRLVPKVLIATQTKVIEAIVDEQGRDLPSTPVISVIPKAPHNTPTDLWRLAAAIASPVCTAIAMQRYAGTALSANALKLSAKQVAKLPLPTNHEPWTQAADQFRHAHHAHQAATPTERTTHIQTFTHAFTDAYRLARADRETLQPWYAART